MIVTTAAEMRRIDQLAIERFGVPAETLMERAGVGAAEAVLARFPHVRKTGVVVLAGKGNNGGDGYVVARALKKKRVRCEVILAVPRADVRPPARTKLLAWERAGGKTTVVTASDLGPLQRALARAGCVVDGLFGTGLAGTVTGLAAEVIALVNASGVPTVALDIPSGLDADRGVPLGSAIEAELTVAFAAPKIGTLLYPGARYTGELAVVDIGMPEAAVAEVAPAGEAILAADAAALLVPRDPDSHKGTNGHVAVIAGGRGKTGAVVLASRAAARAGAGLVTAGVPASELQAVAARLLEEMTSALPDDGEGGLGFPSPHAYADLLDGKQALVTGPGLGVTDARCALVAWIVREAALPAVIDADALNCLARSGPAGAWGAADRPRILTPHPGEMSRLVGKPIAEIEDDRVEIARAFARERQVHLVLKGHRTLLAFPDGRVWINPTGTPAMATGGTGDILTGLIAGFLAQFPRDAEQAIAAAVYLHGLSGEIGAGELGEKCLIATDLLRYLPAAMEQSARIPDRI